MAVLKVWDGSAWQQANSTAATWTVNTSAALSGGGTLAPNGSLTLTVAEVVGAMKNLRITNNATTPNTKLDFGPGRNGAFWEVSLQDTSSPPVAAVVHSTSTLTLDATTNGANGLDTGALGASTWYYHYVIAKADGTTATLLSLSSSSPTMPSGYIYKALTGAMLTDGSTHFITYYQLDKKARIVRTNVLNNVGVSSTGVFQSLDISAVVPPIAQMVDGVCGSGLSGNGANMAVAGDANGTGGRMYFNPTSNTSAADGFYVAGSFSGIPMITAQTLYWTSYLNTSAINRINITGWEY